MPLSLNSVVFHVHLRVRVKRNIFAHACKPVQREHYISMHLKRRYRQRRQISHRCTELGTRRLRRQRRRRERQELWRSEAFPEFPRRARQQERNRRCCVREKGIRWRMGEQRGNRVPICICRDEPTPGNLKQRDWRKRRRYKEIGRKKRRVDVRIRKSGEE